MTSMKLLSRPGRMIRMMVQAKVMGCHQGVSNGHFIHTTVAHNKAKSKIIGNPNMQPHFKDKHSVPRWQHFWLLMMKRKYELEGDAPPQPRLNQFNWDYQAELSAFIARLQIEVEPGILKRAFMEPIKGEAASHELDNEGLVQAGEQLTYSVLEIYLAELLPKVSPECIERCKTYLMSEEVLAYIAQNLGYPDLVQSMEFPIQSSVLRRCFLATVAAMTLQPGDQIQAARFILDFIVTQLVGKDILHDIWRPQNPMGLLTKEMEARGHAQPEVRLTKQSGITTVTPIYFTGIFCDKKLIAESGGETIIKAETDAAKLALKKIYGINVNEFVPNFEILKDSSVENKIRSLNVEVITPEREEPKPERTETSSTKKRGFFFR